VDPAADDGRRTCASARPTVCAFVAHRYSSYPQILSLGTDFASCPQPDERAREVPARDTLITDLRRVSSFGRAREAANERSSRQSPTTSRRIKIAPGVQGREDCPVGPDGLAARRGIAGSESVVGSCSQATGNLGSGRSSRRVETHTSNVGGPARSLRIR
jgi:hypothetical protein